MVLSISFLSYPPTPNLQKNKGVRAGPSRKPLAQQNTRVKPTAGRPPPPKFVNKKPLSSSNKENAPNPQSFQKFNTHVNPNALKFSENATLTSKTEVNFFPIRYRAICITIFYLLLL